MARVMKPSPYPTKTTNSPAKKKNIVKSAKVPAAAKAKTQATKTNTKKAAPKPIAKKAKVAKNSVVKAPVKPSKPSKPAKTEKKP